MGNESVLFAWYTSRNRGEHLSECVTKHVHVLLLIIHYMLYLVQSLAVEWASSGVRVNAVAPGSSIFSSTASSNYGSYDVFQLARPGVPAKRLGSTREVGIRGSTREVGISGSTREMGISGSTRDVGFSGSTREVGISGSAREMGISGSTRQVGISGSTREMGISDCKKSSKARW